MQPQLFEVQAPFESTTAWFLNSGIQQTDGGVARYYQTDLEAFAPVSTEITGYFISALMHAYRRNGAADCLEAAVTAGRFLTDRAWDATLRTFPFELAGQSLKTYFFDTGIIVRGLIALWRETRETRFLEAAVAGGHAMRQFILAGRIHPVLLLPGKDPAPVAVAWSRSPGCYQLKAAMAWHELSQLTGEKVFASDYEQALAWALSGEKDFLPAPQGPERTMDRLHAYCYFLEGLLPVADQHGAMLRNGIDRVSAYLREIEPVFVRSDVYAQLLRVRLLAETFGGIRVAEREANEEATRLTAFQSFESDPRRRGGFYFGRKDTLLPFVNPVSTAFGMQALDLWSDHRAGKPLPGPDSLI